MAIAFMPHEPLVLMISTLNFTPIACMSKNSKEADMRRFVRFRLFLVIHEPDVITRRRLAWHKTKNQNAWLAPTVAVQRGNNW